MRKVRLGAWPALVLIALCATTLVGYGEITLHTYDEGTAQAQWWYCKQHDEVCGTCGDDHCTAANHWNVELGTHSIDDWAYMRLACAEEGPRLFTVADISYASFEYRMLEIPAAQTDSGPAMAFHLFDGTDDYLLISEPADETQTASCALFEPGWGAWWVGAWDGEELESFDSGAATPLADWAAVVGNVGSYEVYGAMVVMGVVGDTVRGDPIGTALAVVDYVTLEWGSPDLYGGTYQIEPAWPDRYDFDDTAQSPLPDPDDPPLQKDYWCDCDHCLPEDDISLWRIAYEGNVPTAIDAELGVTPFPSSSHALYFGNEDWNYEAGEVAVGTYCSPYNELNPADRYVSISFEYLRQVEEYINGNYDWTYVQIWFDDWTIPAGQYDPWSVDNPGDTGPTSPDVTCHDEWKTVWYKDSSDAKESGWQSALITHYLDDQNEPLTHTDYRIQVPPAAVRMRIRFGFNSRDGASNGYFGWMIDNIVKVHSPDPVGCEIDVETLPQGEVGDKYPALAGQPVSPALGYQLEPHGEGYVWSVRGVEKDGVSLGPNLPTRLALTSDGVLYGQPEAGTEGTYLVTLRLECRGGSDTEELVLIIRPLGGSQAGNLIGEEDFQAALGWILDDGSPFTTGPASCSDINLWHETQKVKYAFDDPAQMAEMGHVAYFGVDDLGRPTDPEDPYYCSQRVKGCLISPTYHVSDSEWDGEELVVSFKSWRRVESFAGEYDKTWVAVRINDGSWQTVWERDSSDPSPAYWRWEEESTGITLNAGDKIRIKFCFDSVDGHNNGLTGEAWGWLVDELRLYAGSSTFKILDCPPDSASVGAMYREEVKASGGPNVDYAWDIMTGALPPGLTLEEDGRDYRLAYITGVPRAGSAARYDFTIRAQSPDGKFVATKSCSITVNEDVALTTEDFETDPVWSPGGLWHFTDDGGVVGVDDLGITNHAAYYGKDDHTSPNYKTGSATTGVLALVDQIQLAAQGVEAVRVAFTYWREVEHFAGGGYDQTRVEVKFDSGNWEPAWTCDSGTASVEEWLDAAVEFLVPDGAQTMALRFVFDSVDKWYNDFTGWLVDNLTVSGISPTGVGTLSALSALRQQRAEPRDLASGLSVMNIPNPVTDVHTTTFMVRNADVDAMRIEIYDLSGMLVYEEEVADNELVWHTGNDYGEYLANGIYIYRAFVRIQGEWIETKAQKLVILR